jgi:hypothetical protein
VAVTSARAARITHLENIEDHAPGTGSATLPGGGHACLEPM